MRKAAVIALAAHARQPAARDVLRGALDDSDADVRAHARLALAGEPAPGRQDRVVV